MCSFPQQSHELSAVRFIPQQPGQPWEPWGQVDSGGPPGASEGPWCAQWWGGNGRAVCARVRKCKCTPWHVLWSEMAAHELWSPAPVLTVLGVSGVDTSFRCVSPSCPAQSLWCSSAVVNGLVNWLQVGPCPLPHLWLCVMPGLFCSRSCVPALSSSPAEPLARTSAKGP